MKIFIISLAAVIAVVVLLLFSKVWVISDVVLNNFNINAKLKIKLLMFPVINYDSEKKPKKEKEKESKKEKTEKKVSLKDIKEKKDDVMQAIPIVCRLIRSAVKISYFETDVTVALSDPMDTGLAYSAVSAAANIFYKSVKMKKQFLDIRYDFDSEEGLIIKHKSKIYIRPISILKAYGDYKLGMRN